MWFDIYTCHLLLEKYPQLERELEARPLAELTAALSPNERENAQAEVDRLMMAEAQRCWGKRPPMTFSPLSTSGWPR